MTMYKAITDSCGRLGAVVLAGTLLLSLVSPGLAQTAVQLPRRLPLNPLGSPTRDIAPDATFDLPETNIIVSSSMYSCFSTVEVEGGFIMATIISYTKTGQSGSNGQPAVAYYAKSASTQPGLYPTELPGSPKIKDVTSTFTVDDSNSTVTITATAKDPRSKQTILTTLVVTLSDLSAEGTVTVSYPRQPPPAPVAQPPSPMIETDTTMPPTVEAPNAESTLENTPPPPSEGATLTMVTFLVVMATLTSLLL